MSGEQPTGQVAPVESNEAQPEAVPENTVTPAEGTAPPEEESKPVARVYSEEELQDRVERATAKAAAKAERRAYREALEALKTQQVQAAPPIDDKPRRDQFTNDEDYFDRLTDWKLEQREQKANQARAVETQQTLNQRTEKLYAEAEKLPGFDRDEFDARLTPVIAQALMESEAPAKLMAYLATNTEDADRIRALSPVKQAAEIGKLEAKLASTPVKTTKTPPPINPVGGGTTSTRSLANASMDDYIEMRRKQRPAWA